MPLLLRRFVLAGEVVSNLGVLMMRLVFHPQKYLRDGRPHGRVGRMPHVERSNFEGCGYGSSCPGHTAEYE